MWGLAQSRRQNFTAQVLSPVFNLPLLQLNNLGYQPIVLSQQHIECMPLVRNGTQETFQSSLFEQAH